MSIGNSTPVPFVFPDFKEIEKRNLSPSQGPYVEISLQIFAKLQLVDLRQARLVCKEWKQLIQQANLWKGFYQGSDKSSSQKEIKAVSDQLISLDLPAPKWNSSSTAEFLWHDPGTPISKAMLVKVNAVATYLYTEGYELKGTSGDGDCFFSAFLGSYEGLSRKIPLLDGQKDKISYLRQVLSDIVKHSNHIRAAEIIGKGAWISGLGEGDLLAAALSIPIRLITVNEERSICGIHDRLIFSQTGLAEDDRSQEWETIPQEERPQEYIFIVDLGGHFIYAQKTLHQLEMLSDPFPFFSSLNDSLLPLSLDKSSSTVSEIYVGCMITGNQAEKLYLYIKGGFLKGYLYRKEKLIEEISSNQIQGGLQGEIEPQALIRLVNEVEQPGLFALYNPQATDKKVILLPAPQEGSYLEEYVLSYIEAPLPSANLFCRPNLSKALEKGLKKFGLVSLINEEGINCPTGKTELTKAYFYAQRELYSQALWLRGEKEWFIEQGLQEFSQKVGQDWQEWLGTHSHWLIIIDGLSHISLLRKLGLIELAQKKQGKLIVTSRDKAHDSAIFQIPVNLFSSEESKDYLLQVIHQKDEHSVEEAEKIGQALGGVPSSLKRATDWLNDNAWPLKVYFTRQAASLAEHKAYLEARSNLTLPNEYFTGREADLVALEETLTQGKPLVLAAQVGLGGVGKTQLALQYAYRAAPQYSLIWWLNGESETTLIQSYASLAEKLQIYLTEEEEKEDKALVKKVHHWLKENPGWLLIFDDAENATTLNSWLPESGGHLLITSRKPNWPNAQVFTLGVFKREESIELILKITHLEDQKAEAGKLADLLQNLPLAVSQAAFYIKETRISIEEYREKFEQHYKVLWEFEVPPDIYQATVQVTWHVSMEKIRQEEAREKESNEYPSLADPLMQFCSYLSSHGIPRDLLKEWVIKLYQSETPSLDVNHSIDLLRRYSMIEAHAEAINIHSLVQLVTRDQLKEEKQKEVCGKSINLFASFFDFTKEDIQKTKRNLQLVSHADSISQHALNLQVEKHTVCDVLDSKTLYLVYQGATIHALEILYRQCLPLIKEIYGSTSLQCVRLFHNLGLAYYSLNDLGKAHKFYRKAISISYKLLEIKPNETLDPDKEITSTHVEVMRLLVRTKNAQASILADLKLYSEAIDELKLSIPLLEVLESFPANQLSLASVYRRISEVFINLGNKIEAKNYLKNALSIYHVHLPSDSPERAATLCDLGTILMKSKKYEKAKICFETAFPLLKAALPLYPETFAECATKLGEIYYYAANEAQAKKFFQKALSICRSIKTNNCAELTIRILRKLSAIEMAFKNNWEAMEHSSEALYLIEKSQFKIESDKEAVKAEILFTLGMVCFNLHYYEDAKEKFKQALNLYEQIGSENYSKKILQVLGSLRVLLMRQEHYQEAREYTEKAYQMHKQFSLYNVDYLEVICDLCSILQYFEEYQKIPKYLKQALSLYQKIQAENHQDVQICEYISLILQGIIIKMVSNTEAKKYLVNVLRELNQLSEESINSQNYQKAEEYLLQLLFVYNDVLSSSHGILKKIKNNLGVVLIYQAYYFWQENHDIQMAVRKFEEGINFYEEGDPYSLEFVASAYHNLGCCYASQHEFSKAREKLEKAIQLRPNSGNFCELGHLLYIGGHELEALEFLLQSIAYQIDQKELSYGKMEMNIIDIDLKIKIEQEGLDVTVVASILAYKLLINCCIKLGQLEDAQKNLENFNQKVGASLDPMAHYLLECAKNAAKKAMHD
ncbi:tetratricopeptide repeat protein [Neochlamydia sp. AcF95]|uniref:tetratricopeptide repeat protein n=1 Tax=Neochlamydia sp. AcF95 TaxID=2795734 RepID=UPI001BCA35FB|nr:tetratricopeptide repeat protein [Neochlamydia sp. AcF95]MBS4171554.1 hypothetical protein [Neochlamydia sp. AcF95]